MKVHCLGTGGYHPNERRHTSCFYIPEIGIALDAGTGTFRLCPMLNELQAKSLDFLITHAHLDHVIGLTYLFRLVETNVDTVVVHGEREKLDAIRKHLFSSALFPAMPNLEFRNLEGSFSIGRTQVSYFPLDHPGGSIGFRLDTPGGSIAYVSDTKTPLPPSYLDAIRDVDLLMHECYFDDDKPAEADLTGHSCVSTVASLARQSGAKCLLLTHWNPWYDNDATLHAKAKQIFDNTLVATDGLVVDF